MGLPPGHAAGGHHRKFYGGLVRGLITWAEWTFRRGRKTKDGATESDHAAALARIREKLGKTAKAETSRPPDPVFPQRLAYLWRDFVDIVQGLDGSGFGPPNVTWTTIRAWSEITGATLEPWEARLLVRLGSLRAQIISEKTGEADGGDKNAH